MSAMMGQCPILKLHQRRAMHILIDLPIWRMCNIVADMVVLGRTWLLDAYGLSASSTMHAMMSIWTPDVKLPQGPGVSSVKCVHMLNMWGRGLHKT